MDARSITLALGGRWRGKRGEACCPSHDDKIPSLSIRDGDVAPLFKCHAGCTSREVFDKLRELGILNGATYAANGHALRPKATIVASYPYQDENGNVLFVVERLRPKAFRQKRPDGNGGWIWKLSDTRRVPYRLPELIESVALDHPVFVAEGEKAVEALVGIGVTATCSPHGAGKWRPSYSHYLKDARVVILPDNDEQGELHAKDVARSLMGIARKIRIVRLPVPAKSDPYDWIKGGGTAETLWRLVTGYKTTALQ
jgi:DNA primase